MMLLVNDTPDFNLSLSLYINYEGEYIDCLVNLVYKRKGSTQLKRYAANEFDKALQEYRKLEQMFC